MMKTRMTRFRAACVAAAAAAAPVSAMALTAAAAPSFSLLETGTSKTSDTITAGTATFDLDALLNTDGNAIDGVQYHLQTNPAGAVKYGSTPFTPRNNPFTSSDVQLSPQAGATVQSGSSGTTAFFKSNGSDYPASANYDLATYQFNTSGLGVGQYVFTPVGEEMTNNEGLDTTTFSTPGTFTLNVVANPEPASLGLVSAGAAVLLLRRRRNFGTR